MSESENALRPGAEELRQAIVCLPVGLLALVLAVVVIESNESLGNASLLLGLVFTGIGVVRLVQGLRQRIR